MSLTADLAMKEEYYTYEDYCEWETTEGERYELIDGKVYTMPSPFRVHQEISVALTASFYNLLKGKQYKMFHAPFDVRLNADTKDNTVVQPDLFVVCDKSKLNGISCVGAPDLVVEIISPSSAGHDRVLKFNKYLQAGVKEYWIIEPEIKAVSVHILENNRYITYAYGENETIPVHVLEGCKIDLSEVFA